MRASEIAFVSLLSLAFASGCGHATVDCTDAERCDTAASSGAGVAAPAGAGGAMAVGAGGGRSGSGGTLKSDAAKLSCGWSHACVIARGEVWCWGANDQGQLGDGTTNPAASPVRVAGLTSRQVSVSAGDQHTCSVDVEGEVWCWGSNAFGQLGNATKTPSLVPVRASVDDVTSLSAGESSTAAIRHGRLMLWGKFAHEYLDGHQTIFFSSPLPLQVSSDAARVSNAGDHLCYVRADEGLRCLGVNSDAGQLGDGTNVSRMVGVAPVGLERARAVATWYRSSCAADPSGRVYCWGINIDHSVLDHHETVVNVPSLFPPELSDVVELCVGQFFGCARSQDGAVKCWGRNSNGQHGNGLMGVEPGVSTVVGLQDATALSCGKSHACALAEDGRVLCWGLGTDGQLGWGGYADSDTPVPVDARW